MKEKAWEVGEKTFSGRVIEKSLENEREAWKVDEKNI